LDLLFVAHYSGDIALLQDSVDTRGKIMKRIVLITTVLVVVTIIASSSQGWSQTPEQPARQKQLTAAGSGVNLGITRLLAEVFIKDCRTSDERFNKGSPFWTRD
jgi:hypothetical protein